MICFYKRFKIFANRFKSQATCIGNDREGLSEPDEPQKINNAIELNTANQNRSISNDNKVEPKNEALPKQNENLGNGTVVKEPMIASNPNQKPTEALKTVQTQTDPVKELPKVEQKEPKPADPNEVKSLGQKNFKEKVN